MKLADLKKSIKATNDAASSGVWVPIAQFGIELKIARAGSGNKTFQQALDRALEPFRDKRTKKLDTQNLPEASVKMMNEAINNVYAETVILDWKMDEAYSAKVMAELLNDSPDLFSAIASEAADIRNFYEAAIEEDAKN